MNKITSAIPSAPWLEVRGVTGKGLSIDSFTARTGELWCIWGENRSGVDELVELFDMSKYGANAHLTATTHVWDTYYTKVAKNVLDGSWKPGAVWGGIKDGMIQLAPLNKKIPADVVALVGKTTQSIADGSFHPFSGPIKKQDGSMAVEAGKTLTDNDLLGMTYYVEGVLGSIPK